jgi:hypothetical protein
VIREEAGAINTKSSLVVPAVTVPPLETSYKFRYEATEFAVLSISTSKIPVPDAPVSRLTEAAVVDVSVTVYRAVPIGSPCFAVLAVAITYSGFCWKRGPGDDRVD